MESKNALEFLTIFGISLLFTFAGMHYLKNEFSLGEEKPKIDAPIASTEKVELPTVGVDKVCQVLIQILP